MARRVDVLNCKPEELFLAVSQVEQQLAQKYLMRIGGRHKFPIHCRVLLWAEKLGGRPVGRPAASETDAELWST
jgi:hypothetical protein